MKYVMAFVCSIVSSSTIICSYLGSPRRGGGDSYEGNLNFFIHLFYPVCMPECMSECIPWREGVLTHWYIRFYLRTALQNRDTSNLHQ